MNLMNEIDTENLDVDINQTYSLFEKIKRKVSRNFQTEISSSLSCDLLIKS